MQIIAMPVIGHQLAGWLALLAAQISVQQVLHLFNSSLKILSSALLICDILPACCWSFTETLSMS